ncbi:DUF1015 domain-containing protein [Psychroflexus tropicus]|uniref:DUF1015 domain-containing protein n=1 Tax=Psychroflexus tropicus TaxID=197345 RepID=UPI00036B49D6|nr:DUF1015 domain-containing protein [Psychroflexus tropicus]
MPIVKPFKATRPTRDKVGLIASKPYDTYTKSQIEARLDNNPFSFLHIVNPGYKYNKEISGKERFGLVKNRFEEFKEDGSFIQEESACYYLHKIIYRNEIQFVGFIGAASTEDYENNTIRKHEDTLKEKVDVFTEYLKTVKFNADPVLLTYPDNEVLETISKKLMKKRPEYEFTTTSRETHHFWVIDNLEYQQQIEDEFKAMKHIYIADGHHRSLSHIDLKQQFQAQNDQHTGHEAYNYFMGFFIPESHLRIHEFNRLVKDLNGLSKDEFLIKLDEQFKIENLKQNYYKPTKPHHFSMYLDGDFYELNLRFRNYDFDDSLSRLDAQILYSTILKPILGIEDLRNNARLQYSQGQKDMAYVKGMIDNGEFEVGFGMYPAKIEEMKTIADEGLKMPPKTTFIEPRLRSGITIYEF